MPPSSSYVIAARRTALGRIGGLHKARRIDDLTAPVLKAVLADSQLEPSQVDELIIGNATQGSNPARLIALAAGLPDTVAASTIDRQCGSGLDAILLACRTIAANEADVIIAGGAETISMAPWRVAKPRNIYQLPHFLSFEPHNLASHDDQRSVDTAEELSRHMGISRAAQDAYALEGHRRAAAARAAKRFIGEIVALKATPEEHRDQSVSEADAEEFENQTPFTQDGTLTPGNTSTMHDGAALVVVVSERIWASLGKPPALRLVASVAQGVAPQAEASAPILAMQKLLTRSNGYALPDIGAIEMSESSAVQALALSEALGIKDGILNADGGAVARGHPYGAAGAVLVSRLFTRMLRAPKSERAKLGAVTLGVIGGMGIAALFEASDTPSPK